MVLGIFKIDLRLRGRHTFIGQSVGVLNVFNTLTLKQIFWKTKNIFKRMEYRFLVESTKLKTHYFQTKLPYQKLRQIKCLVQHEPITKNGVLPVTTLFFWKFCLSLWTSHNETIWCTNDPNVYIRAFCKRWSFIWWHWTRMG